MFARLVKTERKRRDHDGTPCSCSFIPHARARRQLGEKDMEKQDLHNTTAAT